MLDYLVKRKKLKLIELLLKLLDLQRYTDVYEFSLIIQIKSQVQSRIILLLFFLLSKKLQIDTLN